MKLRKIIVLLVTLTLMAPALISVATAQDYYPPLVVGEPNLYTATEMVWIIDIKKASGGEAFAFDGQRIDTSSFEYEYRLASDLLTWHDFPEDLRPTKISVTDSIVKLWWNCDQMDSWKAGLSGPFAPTYAIRVSGMLDDGSGFLSTGPGFTSAFRPK